MGLTTPHSKKLIVTKVEQRRGWMDLTMMEGVGDRWEKMEGSCSTGQSPQWAVVPVEEGRRTPSVASQKVSCVSCMACDYPIVVLKELCISVKFASDCVKLQCRLLNFSKQLPVTIVWEEHRLLNFVFIQT
jgi:hypothetical protein